MKKILSITLLLMLAVAINAQKDVTKFLGIPVDGTKSEMIRKLKAKGFTSNPYSIDVLDGEFNGYDVNVHIVTDNNKVWRIMVCDAKMQDAVRIKTRFSSLYLQFLKHNKYLPSEYNKLIPEDEDISYEMSVHNKRYDAVFYQLPEQIDSLAMKEYIISSLTAKYTREQIAEDAEGVFEEYKRAFDTYMYEQCSQKSVWFTISKYNGEYYISMYYDNEYNRADGEDL